MTLKTKISFGLVFLFAVIILIGWIGSYYSYKIANDSKTVLKNNHNTIGFAKTMLMELEKFPGQDHKNYSVFDTSIAAQEKNITEPGEKMLTYEIRLAFEKYKKSIDPQMQEKLMRKYLYRLIDLNMKAILKKDKVEQANAERILSFMAIIGTICFIISFVFIINFPDYIADPIQKLTKSIRQIANKNYAERIDISAKDEFGELADAFNTMAEKLNEYEHSNLAQIISEKKRIEAIIHQIKDGIIGLDTKKNVLFINPVAEQIIGINSNEYSLSSLQKNKQLICLTDDSKIMDDISLTINGEKQFYNKEIFNVTNDNEIIGQFIILRNVTVFKERDAAKTNFIATISHELKTPLASTDIGLRILENDKNVTLTAEQKEIISDLKKDNQRLIKIVNELLNLSQAETGKINIEISEVNVNELIAFAVDTFKQHANEKNIFIKIELSPEIKQIKADKEKSIWVLINLISNAIRYSPQNSEVAITAKNLLQNKVQICVIDSGEGIREEYHKKIFDRFYKIPMQSDRLGSGLGLSISKEFMLAMNGEINVRNYPGKGAEFSLIFKTL